LAGHLLRRLLGTLGVLFGMSILIFAAGVAYSPRIA
jgi:hypothetical protein